MLLTCFCFVIAFFLAPQNMATIGATFASMRPGLTEKQRINWLLATGA